MSERTRFQELVLPHLDAGYNLARWLTRNPHDAEDVVQEASLRAIKYLGALRGGDVRPWFLAIVRNAFNDWCRRNRPAAILRDDDAAPDAIDPAGVDPAGVDPADDPERAAVRSAESQLLADAVAQLPAAFREAVILREIEDLSYKEIARITGVPIGTVMSRLARARSLLQRSAQVQAIRGAVPEVQDELQ